MPGRPAGSTATICALATTVGGTVALVRLSGPEAFAVADRAGFTAHPLSRVQAAHAQTDDGLPYLTVRSTAPATATGEHLVELLIPGSAAAADVVLQRLLAAGATAAGRGAFTRQALANGKLAIDQALAVLAVVESTDARTAALALQRLRGGLGPAVTEVRHHLLGVRAQIESGLDFLDEHDVRSYDAAVVLRQLRDADARLARWQVADHSEGGEPLVALVGAANAGKSALFNALTHGRALVADVPGTTRDPLRGVMPGMPAIGVIDTAGWLPTAVRAGSLDQQALERTAASATSAHLIIACSAPDAPLPAADLAALPADRTVVLATKSDAGQADPRAAVAISARTGAGLDTLIALIHHRLADHGGTAAVAGHDLRAARQHLARACALLEQPQGCDDTLLADDLRRACDELGAVIGATSSDDVLDQIFARFCIGK